MDQKTSQPVVDARVILEILQNASAVMNDPQRRMENSRLDSCQSDREGRFEFKLPPSESSSLSLDVGRVTANKEGYAVAEAVFSMDHIPRPMVLKLSLGGRIEGRVLDSTFAGVPDATVRFAPRTSAETLRLLGTPLGSVASHWESLASTEIVVNTDANGHYAIGNLQEGTWWGQVTNDKGMAVECPITSVQQDQTQVVNFLLPSELLTLHGRIVDRLQNPVKNQMVLAVEGRVPKGVELDLSKLSIKMAHTTTSETGSFVLEGIPYRSVRLSLPRSRQYLLPDQFLELIPGDVREVLLIAEERAKIQGRVVDARTNQPVTAKGSDLLAVYAYDAKSMSQKGSSDVGSDGTFSIWLESPSPVVLKAVLHGSAPAYEPATIGPVLPGAQDLTISLQARK